MRPKKIIKEATSFVKHIYQNRYLVYELTKRDFKQKYASNVMGLAWAIMDPLAMMLIFWLIFGLGFRTGRKMDVPFVTYLISGLSAYMYFQGTLAQATGSIKAYSFLLKKVNFRVSILPIVKILSELVLHFIVIGIAMIIIVFNGIYPTIYWLQIIYYIFASSMLLLGLSWFTSSVNLFFPDISNIISIVLRFFFYLTPVFWDPSIFSKKTIMLLKLNPMFYIVTGYRNSLLYDQPFWENWQLTLYFWGMTFLALVVGIVVFNKLKPHFADVA